MRLLDVFGYYGPTLMVAANIWELRYRAFHVGLFIFYVLLNIFITKQLKGFLKEPRPFSGPSEFRIPFSMEYSGVEQYGMPSGHSSLMFFSLFYLWWVKRNPWYMIGGSFLAALTLYQRFKYKKHTVSQLAVGALLGIALSYVAYKTTNAVFQGKISQQCIETRKKENVAK